MHTSTKSTQRPTSRSTKISKKSPPRLYAISEQERDLYLTNHKRELSLIPLPQQVTIRQTAPFVLNANTHITYSTDQAKAPAELLALLLRPATSLPLSVTQANTTTANTIHFGLVASNESHEAYQLTVNANGVMIKANQAAGLLNGSQTLRQLLPVEIFSDQQTEKVTWQIQPVTITDSPAYSWRGMMLDVSRYFLTKKYVMRYIDIMAMHKLNVLHWHLIDDCGWRIEIKKYPKLTEIGACRGQGEQGHGGFYSHEDIKEVVAYAAARNITVVPEIEIPAHSLSALAAYPELGCFGTHFEMPTAHSISPEIYCVGKETTWRFLEDVMDEVVQLFPAPFIHIGGDEAQYERWNECPDCQARMQQEGLTTPQQLQGWTTVRIEKYLKKHNKQILGWAEIFDCGVTAQTGLMAWHKPEHLIKGATNGNPIVVSFVRHTYFDTAESNLVGEPPCATWTPTVSLAEAYRWHPTPDELIGTPAADKILGPNGCIWTDLLLHYPQLGDRPGEGTHRAEAYVEYISLPRMAALAEVGWTAPEQRNFDDFIARMATAYLRYQKAGYNFRMPTPLLTEVSEKNGKIAITGSTPIAGGSVRYTLDDSLPTIHSDELVDVVLVPKDGNFKAATFSADGRSQSLVDIRGKQLEDYSQIGQRIGDWKSGEVGNQAPIEVILDATGKIDENGDYVITFLYESGESQLMIDGIRVVRNNVDPVAEDLHQGFAGKSAKDNAYHITVDNYQTGASFKVKAQVYGHINADSNGVVLIKKK